MASVERGMARLAVSDAVSVMAIVVMMLMMMVQNGCHGFSHGNILVTGNSVLRAMYCHRPVDKRSPIHLSPECGGRCKIRQDGDVHYALEASHTTYWLDGVNVTLRARANSSYSVTGFTIHALDRVGEVVGLFEGRDDQVVTGTCQDIMTNKVEGNFAVHKVAVHDRKNVTLTWRPDGFNHRTVKFRAWIVHNHSNIFIVESEELTSEKSGEEPVDLMALYQAILHDSQASLNHFENAFPQRETMGFQIDLEDPFSPFNHDTKPEDLFPGSSIARLHSNKSRMPAPVINTDAVHSGILDIPKHNKSIAITTSSEATKKIYPKDRDNMVDGNISEEGVESREEKDTNDDNMISIGEWMKRQRELQDKRNKESRRRKPQDDSDMSFGDLLSLNGLEPNHTHSEGPIKGNTNEQNMDLEIISTNGTFDIISATNDTDGSNETISTATLINNGDTETQEVAMSNESSHLQTDNQTAGSEIETKLGSLGGGPSVVDVQEKIGIEDMGLPNGDAAKIPKPVQEVEIVMEAEINPSADFTSPKHFGVRTPSSSNRIKRTTFKEEQSQIAVSAGNTVQQGVVIREKRDTSKDPLGLGLDSSSGSSGSSSSSRQTPTWAMPPQMAFPGAPGQMSGAPGAAGPSGANPMMQRPGQMMTPFNGMPRQGMAGQNRQNMAMNPIAMQAARAGTGGFNPAMMNQQQMPFGSPGAQMGQGMAAGSQQPLSRPVLLPGQKSGALASASGNPFGGQLPMGPPDQMMMPSQQGGSQLTMMSQGNPFASSPQAMGPSTGFGNPQMMGRSMMGNSPMGGGNPMMGSSFMGGQSGFPRQMGMGGMSSFGSSPSSPMGGMMGGMGGMDGGFSSSPFGSSSMGAYPSMAAMMGRNGNMFGGGMSSNSPYGYPSMSSMMGNSPFGGFGNSRFPGMPAGRNPYGSMNPFMSSMMMRRRSGGSPSPMGMGFPGMPSMMGMGGMRNMGGMGGFGGIRGMGGMPGMAGRGMMGGMGMMGMPGMGAAGGFMPSFMSGRRSRSRSG